MVDDKTMISLINEPSKSREGFRLLVSQSKEKLYWHIRKMVKNHDDADDILQNVYVKVFKNIGDFKGESSLFTWMFRIANNESLNFLKATKNKEKVQLQDFHYNGVTVSQSHFDEEATYQNLMLAIDKLPEKQKEVFMMRYFEELTYKDMEGITGTSQGALKASFHLAVQKITQNLIQK